MLKAIIICPAKDLTQALEAALAGADKVVIVRTLDYYPDPSDLVRILRAHAPEVAFVAVSAPEQFAQVVDVIKTTIPGLAIAAIHDAADPAILVDLIRLGVHDFLALPSDSASVRSLIDRLLQHAERRPLELPSTDRLFTFLPSKPGVGASTIALNTAVALSGSGNPAYKTLLIDFDLNLGIQAFLLKINTAPCVLDACEFASKLDEQLWAQVVTRVRNLDVLHAGTVEPGQRIEPAQIRHLLEFARRNYDVIIADLSGNMEKYSIELMQESKTVFLVCTPELPSLHLARRKVRFFESLDMQDRVSLLLNRVQNRTLISASNVEEIVGLPVFMSFPNDYAGVHEAVTRGEAIAGGRLAKAFAQFSSALNDRKRPGQRKRFIEHFSVLPARYIFRP